MWKENALQKTTVKIASNKCEAHTKMKYCEMCARPSCAHTHQTQCKLRNRQQILICTVRTQRNIILQRSTPPLCALVTYDINSLLKKCLLHLPSLLKEFSNLLALKNLLIHRHHRPFQTTLGHLSRCHDNATTDHMPRGRRAQRRRRLRRQPLDL